MESPSASLDASSSKKRARKSNFTDAEVKALLQQLAVEADVALSPLCDGPTNKMKAEAWERIATRMNACSEEIRTPDELRSKWRCLKKAVAKQLQKQMKTGIEARPLPYQDIIISLSVRNKSLFMDWEEQSNLSLDSGPQTPEDSTAFQEMQNCFTDKAEPSSASSPPDVPSTSSVTEVKDSEERDDDDILESGPLKRGFPSVLSTLSSKKLKTVSDTARCEKLVQENVWMNCGLLDNADAQQKSLFARYLQSEIVKNRAKKILIENLNRKVLLEIEKLERELGDTNDQDLG
ncbi:uncharacterized protein LOC112570516 isoform X1 [Pomacea canaliculata]|uniref:uncharacterized protein LOC112570516 isoform X1 n=1 Tax=Pomacea canaliculata TaxID=400727 RepID=UPI000D72C73D|nr:uncharacterized protein LOC112570516 isoform X1 [Pomacea canaliculata]XP_025104770.1 uncharacterized protein LOC112570516 isoform X1 [Pomacea canaliculata]XP_025104771.1 uncharacterized protein LOC112570516 isoform X1 [Pomacea canaliculata]